MGTGRFWENLLIIFSFNVFLSNLAFSILNTKTNKSKNIRKAKRVFWLFMSVGGMVLFLEALWELSLLKYMAADQTNPATTLAVINKVVPYAIFVHFAVFFLLILTLNFLKSLLLLPLTIWRIHKLVFK